MGCDADLAWCAGFLDGEGSFLLATISNADGRRKATISADQIVREPLDKLARVIGGRVSGPIRNTSAGNPIYRWAMREPRTTIPRILPHLTVKRRKAELILAHSLTFSLSHSKGIPPEVLAERQRIELEFAALRGLGRGGQVAIGCDIHVRVEYLAAAETVGLVDGKVEVITDRPQTVKVVDGDLKVVDANSDETGAIASLGWVPAEKLTPKEDVPFNSYYVERLDPAWRDEKGKPIDPERLKEIKEEWDAKPSLELDYHDRFYSGRNYRLFELLAGVRGDEENALWEERGFPEDASAEVTEDYEEWGADAHTPSWQTLDELTEIDWKALMSEGGQFWGGDWLQTLERMKDVSVALCNGEQTAVRIVYWFDN